MVPASAPKQANVTRPQLTAAFEMPAGLGHGNARGPIQRVAVDAGADCRKRDRLDPLLAGDLVAAPIAPWQERGLAVRAALPHGAHGVDHEAGGEVVGTG